MYQSIVEVTDYEHRNTVVTYIVTPYPHIVLSKCLVYIMFKRIYDLSTMYFL